MKIIVAHGTFDIIHYGHITYLENAKKLGDYLIVLVTSDKIAHNNGKNPYFNENIRVKMISSLKCVDQTIIRDEEISEELLKKLNTNIFVTTYEGFKTDSNFTCRIKIVKRTDGISSTDIKKHLETINNIN